RNPSVVLIREAREARNQPVGLHQPERKLLVSHIHAAAELHCKAASATDAIVSMSTSEEGVRERGDSALVGRDNRSERVVGVTQDRTIGAAGVYVYVDATRNV